MNAVVLAVLVLSVATPRLVDGVAAVVDRRVVTRTEVDVEARLALLARGVPGALDVALDAPLRAAMLDSILVEELLALEARRMAGIVVREPDVDAALASLEQQLASDGGFTAFQARFAVDEESVRNVLRRQLIARALLARWFRALPAPSGDDVLAYVAEHPGESDDDVRSALARRAEERLVAARVAELKRQVEVRVVASWAHKTP